RSSEAVRQVDLRDRDDLRQAGCGVEAVAAVGVDGHGRDIQLVQEVSPCLGLLVQVDASDVPLRVFLGELVEVGQLAAAGLTPPGPHVDDRGFTGQGCAKVGGLILAAAEAGQL